MSTRVMWWFKVQDVGRKHCINSNLTQSAKTKWLHHDFYKQFEESILNVMEFYAFFKSPIKSSQAVSHMILSS